ncbi:MAG: hypothetical protein VX549_10290 [Pseudomonadota bacterium]|nr:hypothetical protein [Pseudomonadota bacterium]
MDFSFHADHDCNRVLNLLNRDSHGLSQGVTRRLLAYHWSLLPVAEDGLERALTQLSNEALIELDDRRVALTVTGYAQLIDPDCAAIEQDAPSELHLRAGSPTEYSLRAIALDVMTRGGATRLPLKELTERWAVSGLRAGELRDAIDLLQRDNLATFGGLRTRTVILTKDGQAYVAGRPPPGALLSMAPALRREDLSAGRVDSKTLCLLAAHTVQNSESRGSTSFGEVLYRLAQLKIPDFRAFLSLELLYRLHHVDFAADTGSLHLTASGNKLARAARGRAIQWVIGQSVQQS